MLDEITYQPFNMEIRVNKVMKPLCIIPFPKYQTKLLMKSFQYNDRTKRGNSCATTLGLIFNEEDDLIFYKYIRDFEEIFEKYAIEINEIQERIIDKGTNKEMLTGKIKEFQIALYRLIETLHAAELAISNQDQQAFPDGDHEGSVTPRATTVKYKIVVCGDPAVGKTSTILQYTNKAFKRTYIPTLGVNLTEKTTHPGVRHHRSSDVPKHQRLVQGREIRHW